jgi:hypothetical protein
LGAVVHARDTQVKSVFLARTIFFKILNYLYAGR